MCVPSEKAGQKGGETSWQKSILYPLSFFTKDPFPPLSLPSFFFSLLSFALTIDASLMSFRISFDRKAVRKE